MLHTLDLDDITYRRVLLGDTPYWLYSDGTMLPVVRGGDGDDPDDDEPDPDPDDDPDDDDPDPDPDDDPKPDKDAEIKKWKKLARKHEGRSKANADAARELAELKKNDLPADKRALQEAEERGRKAAATQHAQALAGAKIEAALAGIVDDPAEFVEDLNLAKFVTDDGEVDTDAIDELKTRWAARKGKENADDDDPDDDTSADGRKKKADLKQGKRGRHAGGKTQITRAEMARMTPEQIDQAHREGRLNEMQGIQT